MKVQKKYILLPTVVLALVLIIHQVWIAFPAWYSVVYQNGLFRLIRIVYDYLVGFWLPVPMIWISFLFIFYYMFFRNRKHKNILSLLAQLFGHFCMLISLFYILWGWNYAQKPIVENLGIVYTKPDSIRLFQEIDWCIQEVYRLRTELQDDALSLDYHPDKLVLENTIREDLSKTLVKMDFPAYGRPRVRLLKPKGFLLRIKTAGIYMPFAFEGHIDEGLLPLEWPYTIAHEMSHGYGVADEGECNFTAFVACLQSDDLYLQYSAMIDYSLYVLRDIHRVNPLKRKKYIKEFHPGFLADLQAMKLNGDKYPDILPALRDFMYDSYLKTNGVKAGLKSYSQLVNHVIQYRDKIDTLK